ncbi:metallophosphoesterase [Vicingus serpentipes]|uniref:Metallophosphoesterase n=1 Tax=Vicingus serpentipes TaxID=1926625 RepID=A0A5C6RTY8_9FLAO|nr:metallophosphoesterase [Vicingus serpentipes]TXB65479.1 metallophosphoesterase [Vicingus serpentipes]
MYLKFILTSIFFIVIIDWYYYRSFNAIVKKITHNLKQPLQIAYWIYTAATIGLMFYIASYFSSNIKPPKIVRVYVLGFVFVVLISKLIGCIFIIAHDIEILIIYLKKKLNPTIKSEGKNQITRKDFLKKTGVIVSALPFGTLVFGMLKSAFDYTVKRKSITIENLPDSFKGLRIVQISDLHVGSFISTEPLETAIKIIKQQKPDIIFFTGDLVNDITEEAIPFIETLKTISAPMGVFSILGNHDYGDYYYQKDDLAGKKHNYDLMKTVHAKLGWKLLLNENHILTKNNERLAILGVENWGGALRFPKYGDIDKAKVGCLEDDVKLLLSHDPSHWDAIILPEHKDIVLTFSGHTHGMQFGIEIPGFKWSPSKYLYKQWAGLYKKNNQYIYVNRGLGFLGYPGRVGILPEITVIELD